LVAKQLHLHTVVLRHKRVKAKLIAPAPPQNATARLKSLARQLSTHRPMSNLTLIVFILTIAFPLLELALLIKLGGVIGVAATFGVIFSTAILGTLVVRHQGVGVMRRMATLARSGEPPVLPMLEGMVLMAAGICLIAPGLITDFIGLVLLVPPIRRYVASWLASTGLPRARQAQPHTPRQASTERLRPRRPTEPAPTIEGDFERLDEKTVVSPPQSTTKPPPNP
jgi:UPF0716 protein FxsA